jgi:hypothetical protein
MPIVNGKEFSYTPAGIKAAAAARKKKRKRKSPSKALRKRKRKKKSGASLYAEWSKKRKQKA